jgi:TatD DNase family protein
MATSEDRLEESESSGTTASRVPQPTEDEDASTAEHAPRDTLFRNHKGKVCDPPIVEASVADTHAHLIMLSDAGLSLARCAAHHVDFVEAMVDPPEGTETYDLLDTWRAQARQQLDSWAADGWRAADGRDLTEVPVPDVRIGVGVHPHNAKYYTAACERTLVECAADPRTSCIGEIGLDYHYDLSPRPLQQEVFARQLEIAQQMELPVSLHIREAHDDALAIIERTGLPEAGCILHCFNLDREGLTPWLELGCDIALGGPLTFKKSDYVREAVTLIPRDRLITETDSPFMAPVPLRGTTCGPAHTIFTAQLLYEVYSTAHPEDTDEKAFLQAVYDNARALLDSEPSPWQKSRPRIDLLLSSAQGCVSEEESARLVAETTDEDA